MTPDAAMIRDAARQASVCSARFRLPLRTRLWQGAAGEMAGFGTGSSMDFQDHRPYFPGDDPRHINWQAYARTGQYTMKLFREETRPTVDVLFDVTPSMFVTAAKARRSLELFHFAVENALHCGASVEARLLDAGAAHLVPLAAVHAADWHTHLPAPTAKFLPTPASVPLRQGGLRIFISDLLFPGEPTPWMRALTGRGGAAIVLAPFAPEEEAAPEWSGTCDFVDIETAARHTRFLDPGTLRRYQAAYLAHFQTWKDHARRFHVPLAAVSAAGSLETALGAEALAVQAVEPAA
jgi:uncharacterized protein (DUF58 family)